MYYIFPSHFVQSVYFILKSIKKCFYFFSKNVKVLLFDFYVFKQLEFVLFFPFISKHCSVIYQILSIYTYTLTCVHLYIFVLSLENITYNLPSSEILRVPPWIPYENWQSHPGILSLEQNASRMLSFLRHHGIGILHSTFLRIQADSEFRKQDSRGYTGYGELTQEFNQHS